jgi:hemoglobin
MRHAEFPITQDARDAWLIAMHKAVNGVEMDAALRAELWIYLEMAANSLVNQPD